MKKVLFTLAALFAFGLAANAQAQADYPAPLMQFCTADGTQLTEVELAPGESMDVYIRLVGGEQWPGNDNYVFISGAQIAHKMLQADGTAMGNVGADNGYVIIENPEVWNEDDEEWVPQGWMRANPGGFITAIATNAIASVNPYPGVYRQMWNAMSADGRFARRSAANNTPVGVVFTIKAAENWTQDFATFTLDKDYTIFNLGYTQAGNGITENRCNYDMELKIKNKNAAPTPVAPNPPVITFEENGDVLTVTVTAEEGCTLIVNGQEIDSNTYSYVVNRTYADQTVNVEAYAVKGDLQSEKAEDSYTLTAKDKETVDAPVISYETTATQVIVTVTWPQSDGDQVYTGQYTYDRPAYGQPDESYDVEAYTTEGATCAASEHATATIPVPAQNPAWQAVDAPVISYETTATEVVVTVTWPTTTGQQVYTGEYTYPRPAYGEADQSYNVEAYTTADYPYSESEHATATIPVPAQDPAWQAVDAPVIETTMDANNVYVTITWPTNTTGEHVYTGEYTYPRGETAQSYDVEAYTTEDYPYSESEHATATINVPAKEVTPVNVGAPTFEGYTMDGITGYGVYIYPSTPADANIMYMVEVWNPATQSYDLLTDWTEYQGTPGEIYYTNIGGKYKVTAYAYVGENKSTEISYEFVVQEITGIDEMNAGKAIANVRYFNMAGQEMQEANGMTIVVTTYTDGTSSAVKVMK